MMQIWIAIMISCTGSISDPTIRCDYGGSDEVYASQAQCEREAPKAYRRPVRCISVDVEMKEKETKVILK